MVTNYTGSSIIYQFTAPELLSRKHIKDKKIKNFSFPADIENHSNNGSVQREIWTKPANFFSFFFFFL